MKAARLLALGVVAVLLLGVVSTLFSLLTGGPDEGLLQPGDRNDAPLPGATAGRATAATTGPRRVGPVVMGKMGNATVRAQLGASAWRLLHTMAGKFPHNPRSDEQEAVVDFMYLFARLYPCGEWYGLVFCACVHTWLILTFHARRDIFRSAAHFSKLLEAHPPQVQDRETFVAWMCMVHNLVNKRLDKAQFDCSKAAETWKCGCDEEGGDAGGNTSALPSIATLA
jgi:hypothetical protein